MSPYQVSVIIFALKLFVEQQNISYINFLNILVMEEGKPQAKPMGSMKVTQELRMSKTQILNIADNFQAYACCIKYLNSYNYKQNGMNGFMKESEDIMKYLDSRFSTTKYSYLPWLKFLDVANKMVSPFMEHLEEYRNKLTNLIRYVLLNNGNKNINEADWRILRKIYSAKSIFEQSLINVIDKNKFLEGFLHEIDNSLKYLIWVQDTFIIEYTRTLLNNIKSYCKDNANRENAINAIKCGRFDKKGERFNKMKFLDFTLVLGEDGGLFLLLNSLDDAKFRDSLDHLVGKQYIKEKSAKGKNGKSNKVILGKGSFGKVRFAINIFYINKYPGDIVCVKKTNNLRELSNNSFVSAQEMITTSTLEDYFASEMSELIYSPKVVDMSIIIQEIQEVEIVHQKGYLFMEIVPENTGTKIFSLSKYQKWQYQKPYLLDMFQKVNKLLKNNVAFTDLKPDNTLFNVYNRKTSLIDLGGTVKDQDLKHYVGPYQYTKDFSAPEINDHKENAEIDLVSTVSYACGIIVKYLAQKTDFNKKSLEQFASKLMVDRIPIEEAEKQLEKLGDQKWKQAVIFSNYINRIESRLETSKSSISINQDIEETMKIFIPLNVTEEDPYKFANLKTIDLFAQINAFLKQKSSGVFLLLGKAGSGKSVVLQQKFIECIHEWSEGRPLPIFFNLANNTSLPKILQSMDDELITNLQKNIKGKQIILFIDSFDEGVDMHNCRQTLVNGYLDQLYNQQKDNVKIIISCRSDYIQDDKDEAWFQPKFGIYSRFYITSLDYLEATKWSEYIKLWCKQKGKENKIDICNQNIKKFKEIIVTGFIFQIFMEVFVSIPSNLTNFVNKIELYKLYIRYYIIKRLQKLNKQQRRFINESFVTTNPHTILEDRIMEIGGYLASKMHITDNFRLKNGDPIFSLLGYKGSQPVKIQKLWFIFKLLPLKIESKETFTSKYDFKQEVAIGFIHDTIKNFFLLQEIKKQLKSTGQTKILSARNISQNTELVGFVRDSIENYREPELIEQLQHLIEVTKTNKSAENVTAAANAMTILIAAQICLSGMNFSDISVRGANVKNGVFQHSNFSNADLSAVDLTNTDLVGCKFNGTNMANIQLSQIPILYKTDSSIYTTVFAPDSKTFAMSLQSGQILIYQFSSKKIKLVLKGHEKQCLGLIYSKDGSRIVSGSHDGTVKIWNSSTGSILIDIKLGYIISGVSYSQDEKNIAAAGDSRDIKVFDANSGKEISCYKTQQKYKSVISICYSPNGKQFAFATQADSLFLIIIMNSSNGQVLHKLQKDNHKKQIRCVCYSPNGKYLASCSADQTIKIWNAQRKYELIKTIHAHSDMVTRICFSPNSKFIASGSADNILKIIDVETSTIIKEMYGHRVWIISVCYSPDSRYIITGGGERQIRMWDTNASYMVLQNIPKVRKRIIKIGFRTGSPYIAVSFDDNSPLALYNLVYFTFFRYILHTDSENPQFITITPDFKEVIYIRNGQVYTHNIQANKTTKKDYGDQVFLCISNDCKWAISRSQAITSKVDFKIWDLVNGKLTFEQKKEENIPICTIAAISPDSTLFAIDQGVIDPNAEKQIRIFNMSDGSPKSAMSFERPISALLFASDNSFVLAAGSQQSKPSLINTWNPQDGDLTRYLETNNRDILCLRLLKDNNRILVGFSNLSLTLYSLDEHKSENDFYGHNGAIVDCYAFSEDDKKILSASNDCTLRMWECKDVEGTNKWCFTRSIIGAETPLSVAYSEMNDVRNISEDNFKVFEQRYAKITANRSNVQAYNPQPMENNLVRYREKICAEIEKALQIKRVEINLDNIITQAEESEIYRKPEKSLQIAAPLLKNTNSQSTNYNNYSGGDDYEGGGGGCCCSIYSVRLVYDNPLLNIENGLQKAAKMLNKTVSQTLKIAEDAKMAKLLAKLIE